MVQAQIWTKIGAIVTVPSGNIIISYKLTNGICNIKKVEHRAQTTTSHKDISAL